MLALPFYAVAQPGGGGAILSPTGNVHFNTLTQNAAVIKDLGLTAEQIDALLRVEQDFRPDPPPPREPGERPSPPDLEERMQRQDAMWMTVNQMLTPEQRIKLKERAFQLSGGLSAPRLHERLLDTLDLTASQREAVRKIAVELEQETRIARENSGLTSEERRVADEERNAKYAEQVRDVLTSEQIAKAEKLTSEIPALREQLGLPEQRTPRQGLPGLVQRAAQDLGRRIGSSYGDYIPGPNSWQPGQGIPEGYRIERNSRFPRRESE